MFSLFSWQEPSGVPFLSNLVRILPEQTIRIAFTVWNLNIHTLRAYVDGSRFQNRASRLNLNILY